MLDHVKTEIDRYDDTFSEVTLFIGGMGDGKVEVTLHLTSQRIQTDSFCQLVCDRVEPALIADVKPVLQNLLDSSSDREMKAVFGVVIHHGKKIG